MLADSVDASRTLVEPTAARLQNLVDKIAMSKLLDGQSRMWLDPAATRSGQDVLSSRDAIYHGQSSMLGRPPLETGGTERRTPAGWAVDIQRFRWAGMR